MPIIVGFMVTPKVDIADICERVGNIDRWAELRLQPGLDSPEQPEAHLAVIARERDHETDLPMA